MTDRPVRIFVSYSHSDRAYLGEQSLLGFLRGLEREGAEFWVDEQLAAGDRWDDQIRLRIAQADIALVLVSQSFLNSEYCTSVELAEFLERSRQAGMIILPVILSPCEWERHSWLRDTQHLPGGGQTVEENYVDAGARKRLYLKILSSLRERIDSVRAAPAQPPPVERSIGGERRQVTALQCELTTAQRSLDPEEIVELLPEYRARVAGIVQRMEGHVAQRQGRRLLVYFGVPRLHEDDARRAVLAAREIVDLAKSLDRSLAMKVAIHTGPMVLSSAPDEEGEPMLVGDVPDVVAAILNATPPDTIKASESTQELVDKIFLSDPGGSVKVGDDGRPLQLFVFTGAQKASGVRPAVGVSGHKAFVAREHELELLRQRWELAREGEGQVVCIRGDAGLGKTRLVDELTAAVATEPMQWLKARCSPYHQNTELYPLVDLLQRVLRLTNPNAELSSAQRLEALVRGMDMPAERVVPLLSALLGLPLGPGDQPVSLSPEGRRKKTLEAVLDLIFRQAARRPVLLIVEDLQWIDASTLDFLDLLVQMQATARILTVLTFRPELDPPWGNLSYVSEIALRRLSATEARALISKLAEGHWLPEKMVKDIVRKADGVPLFAEELTRMVTESGSESAGDETLSVPATLEGSLIARLDRLDTAKEVAQVASVIGRDFFRELLAEAVPVDQAALVRDLERLLHSEIIQRRGLPSDASYYFFKHALIQQAAYKSILTRDVRRLHGKIAEVLESKFPELAQRQPEVVAYHLTRAGQTEKAIDYWAKAAERSIANSANHEAVAHLTKCLELLEELPEGRERDQREMRLRTALALPLIATKGYAAPEVEETLGRAQRLCAQLGDDAQLFHVLRLLWSFEMVHGDHHKAYRAAQQMERMVSSHDSAAQRMEVDRVLGSSELYLGRLTEARQHLESAIALYDRERDHAHVLLYGQDPGVSCLANLTLTLGLLGCPDQARTRSEEAVALARELDHPYSLCFALYFRCWYDVFNRDLDGLQTTVEEMIAVSRHQSFPFWESAGMILQAWLRTQRGEPEAGLAAMSELLARSLERGARLFFPTFHCMIAEVHLAQGSVDAGLAAVETGLALCAATGEVFYEPQLRRVKGELQAIRP